MKKIVKNFKSDVVTPMQQQRLMKVNKFLSSKYVLGTSAVVLAIILFLFFNYVLNLFSNLKYIFTDIDNAQAYTGLKYAFIIRPQNLIFYIVIVIVIMIAITMFIYKIRTAYKDLNVGQKGDERWATIEEIKEQYKAVPEKTEHFEGKGGVPVCWYKNEIYIDRSPVHTVVWGITRAGKGETITYPTIDIYSRSSEQPSMIILDPKLDEYPTCYYTLTQRGYDVYLFNLNDLLHNIGFNPIQLSIDEYKVGNIAEAELILNNYCYGIFHTNEAIAAAKEPFWADGSQGILYCIIWAQLEDNLLKDKLINEQNQKLWDKKQKAFSELSEEKQQQVREKIKKMKSSPEEMQIRLLSFKYIPLEYTYIPTTENEKKCTMYSAVKTFLSLLDVEVQDGKKTLTGIDVYFKMRPLDDKARLRFSSSKAASANQKGNLYQYMAQQINNYLLDNVAKFTSHNTIKMLDIGFGEKPIAVFLAIPDYDKSLHVLATTFIDQAYFILSRYASRTPSKACKRDILFYLEEVGNMPEINCLQALTTMGLSRNMYAVLSLQSYSQFEEIYGEKVAQTIIGNCGNQIYIKADRDTTKRFAEDIGNETFIDANRMGHKLSLNKTFTETPEEKPLLNINQLMDLQEEECVVRRTMMRRDLNGNKIRAFPIFNHGDTSFKMRYKYMADEFPSGIDIYSLPTGDNSQINLEEHTFDLREFFADLQYGSENISPQGGGSATKKEKKVVPVPEREQFSNIDVLRDSKALVAELKNGSVLLIMIKNMLGIDRVDMTVSEAIREIELAEKAVMISSDQKDSLFMLLEESEVNI
ncbi:MAG: type IV secretory system conjugative DNA transfer family protein [Ruminococcus sp.]|nr:type IV secretory system conjugative DNA transfer family protein [Ruminococcus sp.]